MSTRHRQGGLNLEGVIKPPERGYRILHVDDDAMFLDLVSEYLAREQENEQEGFDITSETSVEEALEHQEMGKFDGIVSDYDMPGMDGLAFLTELRRLHPELPFILFTGQGSEDIASEAISAGVTDYLRKKGGASQFTLLANRLANAVGRYWLERQMTRGFEALETAREGISLLSDDGHFVYLNEAFADVTGYARRELLDSHWERLYPEDEVDIIHDEILPTVPVEGRWSGVTTYVRKDGERIQVDHALRYTEDGTMICLIREVDEG